MGQAAARHFDEVYNSLRQTIASLLPKNNTKVLIADLRDPVTYLRVLDRLKSRFDEVQYYKAMIEETYVEHFLSFASKIMATLAEINEKVETNQGPRFEDSYEQYLRDSIDNWNAIRKEIIQIIDGSSHQKVEETAKKLETRITNFEKRFRPRARRAELEKQGEQFTNTAIESKGNAKKWMIAITLSILLFVVLIVVFLKYSLIGENTLENVTAINDRVPQSENLALNFFLFKHLAIRAVIISFCLYLIAFCVKNYNAAKHNQMVNLQRANSINGAMWLIESVSDETGEQILLQAANSIFTHQPTGYSTKEPENINTIAEKVANKIINESEH